MEAAGAPRRWPRRRSAQCIIDQCAIGISAAPDQQADDDDRGFDARRCGHQLARSDDYAIASTINGGGGAFGQRLTPWPAELRQQADGFRTLGEPAGAHAPSTAIMLICAAPTRLARAAWYSGDE